MAVALAILVGPLAKPPALAPNPIIMSNAIPQTQLFPVLPSTLLVARHLPFCPAVHSKVHKHVPKFIMAALAVLFCLLGVFVELAGVTRTSLDRWRIRGVDVFPR